MSYILSHIKSSPFPEVDIVEISKGLISIRHNKLQDNVFLSIFHFICQYIILCSRENEKYRFNQSYIIAY